MILTIPVLLYQLLFVLILFIASRISARALLIAFVLCVIWTATHIFFPLLMLLQGAVIVGSYIVFRRRHKIPQEFDPK
jgi:hypothetical protein